MKVGETLHRIHRRGLEPLFFGPGAGKRATYRFDSPSGRFGVLYAALDFDAALVETLLRNPSHRFVDGDDIVSRSHCKLSLSMPLRVVPVYGEYLQQLGTDNSISTGPYDACGLWADALWTHKDAPDGIAYQSRHVSDRICLAIFERAAPKLTVMVSEPLKIAGVKRILTGFGKEILKSH
jgi:hypothetical protein